MSEELDNGFKEWWDERVEDLTETHGCYTIDAIKAIALSAWQRSRQVTALEAYDAIQEDIRRHLTGNHKE